MSTWIEDRVSPNLAPHESTDPNLRGKTVVASKHVTASLTDDLVKKVKSLLRNYNEVDAKQLGAWIETNFRVNSPKTPSGGKAVKEKLQRMVWVLKNRMSQGTTAEAAASEVKSDWETLESKLNILIKLTDEGGTIVPKEVTSGIATYLNEAGVSESELKVYIKRLDAVFKELKGWRRKSLAGGIKVALKPASAFNGTVSGKYHRASDTLWVRTTPAILKRGSGYASFEYIIVHELGHRYEAKNKLPLDFDKPEWQTSRYSRQEGEAFAELFALSNFGITGQGDPGVLDRFENVMIGLKTASHEHYRTVCSGCGTIITQCRCTGPKIEKAGLCDTCDPEGAKKRADVYQKALEEAIRPLVAVKTKPSFPNPVDEYEPTNERLWRDVLDVASGDRRDLTIRDRTINSPNDGRGYRGMPSNPKGIAWAVKQYKGFGGSFKKQAGTVVKELGSPKFQKVDVSKTGWDRRLARLDSGSIEVTEGLDPEAEKLAEEGRIRLVGTDGLRWYWDSPTLGRVD